MSTASPCTRGARTRLARKLFFFDYDGTLAVPRTRTIPHSTRDALQTLRDEGHFIALATGRLQCNAVDYIDALGIDNIVADGGYSVTVDGKLVWMEPLALEPCRECLRRLEAAGIVWAVQLGNEMLRYTPFADFDAIAGDYYVPTQVDPTLSIDGLDAIYKIYIPCKRADEAAFVASGVLDGVPWVRYNDDSVFVEPLSKAVGIKKMVDIIGGSYSDVVVFGDGKNDISMFLPEWTSIAMGNAVPQLKEHADYVTDDCDKDGIANACRHFGWI